MSAYTKGPWELVPQTGAGGLIAHSYYTDDQMNPKGLRLIAFMMSRKSSIKEDEANSRLIIAAPDLLEALNEITHNYAQHVGENTFSVIQARKAISKAEGL